MVAPFKPYHRSLKYYDMSPSGSRVLKYYLYATGVKQVRPYIDTELSLTIDQIKSGDYEAMTWGTWSDSSIVQVKARNKARASFVDALGQASQLGSTFTAEGRKSWDSVVDTVTRALMSAKAVSAGKLGRAAKILGVEPPIKYVKTYYGGKVTKKNPLGLSRKRVVRGVYVMPTSKRAAQRLGDKWLWWSYGVQPLASDIYNAMDVLQRPQPSTRVVGRGNDSFFERVSDYGYSGTYSCSVQCSADVRVSNPNLWLANQLGLVNPAQWVLEGIPLSFVVDWFSNLSQVVTQLTDFVGLEIAKPLTIEKFTIEVSRSPPYVPGSMKRFSFERRIGVPEAKLVFAYERFNWQRGANAISLLVNMLRK